MVFSNHNKVINLAGIIGGMETACTNNTNDVLVECAYFLPESIIGRAVKYNVQSDASHKFERGVDPTIQEKALRRFIQIVADHAKIIKAEIFSYSSGNFQNKELEINFSKINSILGTNKNNHEYKDALMKLGFNYDKCIRVPSYRNDIDNINDLAGASVAAKAYEESIKGATNSLNSVNESYSTISATAKDLADSSASVKEAVGLTQEYKENLKSASTSLGAIVTASGQITETAANMSKAQDDAVKLQKELHDLTENLSKLNKIYVGMYDAMHK